MAFQLIGRERNNAVQYFHIKRIGLEVRVIVGGNAFVPFIELESDDGDRDNDKR